MEQDAARRQKPTCVLVLQGGGALGAYHIGVYQALHEHGFEPDWLCGISIGAINAAVLAGNPPEQRLAQLEALWQAISWPELLPHSASTTIQGFWNTLSNAQALAFGQPGFFSPRPINPFFAPSGTPATESFYDTTPLRQTLLDHADFARINQGNGPRLSVGVTDVAVGALAFFDSRSTPGGLGPEHIIASGSLPPGFAATEIGGRFYWDGACVSNTPLEAVLNDTPPGHTVAFVIDLWSPTGTAPTTMNEVLWRAKQIQYASRTAHHVDSVATKINLRHALGTKAEAGQRLDIVHVIYHPAEDQIPASDAEFSRVSIAERRAAGYADMREALAEQPWTRVPKPAQLGAMVHRVSRCQVTTLAEPNLRTTSDRTAPPLGGE
jgi:NTE family protein